MRTLSTGDPSTATPQRAGSDHDIRASRLAVVAAAVLVAGCAAAGLWLTRHGTRLHLGSTYPVAGRYELHLSAWLLVPLALAVLTVWWGPRLAARLPWRGLLATAPMVAAAWAVALAAVAGPAAIAEPLTTRYEYLHDVERVSALGLDTFVRTFTAHIVGAPDAPGWTVHVAGHPPLATLVFVLLADAGLAQAGWAAAVCVAGGALAVPAVLSTVGVLAGEQAARSAAPFVAVAPAALWVATSADALFAGVGAAGICALAHAPRIRGVPGDALAAAGGVTLGCALFLSYGLVLLAPLAVVVVAARRRIRPLLIGAIGVATVVAAFAAAGFWWLDGLALVSQRMMAGAWRERPPAYFLVADVAALAVAAGPAVVAAVPLAWRARNRLRLVALPGVALLAVATATVSQLARGEVERIFLPWTVWLLTLPGLLPAHRTRAWLAAQAGWALIISVTTSLWW